MCEIKNRGVSGGLSVVFVAFKRQTNSEYLDIVLTVWAYSGEAPRLSNLVAGVQLPLGPHLFAEN